MSKTNLKHDEYHKSEYHRRGNDFLNESLLPQYHKSIPPLTIFAPPH